MTCPCNAVPVRFAEGDVRAEMRAHDALAVLPRDAEARQVIAPIPVYLPTLPYPHKMGPSLSCDLGFLA